jgi:Nitroreductase
MKNITIDQIYERKSVRQYLDKDITKEDKKLIFDSIIQAPTAGNMSLYSVIEVSDQSIKDKLVISCDNQPFIASAPLVLVFLADYKRWFDLFSHYSNDLRSLDSGDLFLAMSDALIAAQNAVVAAESLGIGSCYIGDILEKYEYHQELFKLPNGVIPVGMLCFGYPTELQKTRKKPNRFKKEDLFHLNHYQEASIDSLKEMIKEKQNLTEEKLSTWVKAFLERKHNGDFSIEMSRSVNEMIKAWRK